MTYKNVFLSFIKIKITIILSIQLLLIPQLAFAGLENIGSMVGIFASDIALAGARAEGVPDAASAYHNPAAIAFAPYTQLTIGHSYFQPDFEGKTGGRSQKFSEANRIIGLGVVLDLGQFFTNDYPVGMGIALLVDDNFGTIVAFDHEIYPNGQFIRYGTRSLALFHSLGFQLVKGLNFGLAYTLTYSARVDIIQNVDITGNTEDEQIILEGKPILSPAAGLQYCHEKLKIGLVYRNKFRAIVDPVSGSTTAMIGQTDILTVPTAYSFKDSFTPSQFVIGLGILPEESVSVNVQGEYHRWSDYNEEISNCNDGDCGVKTHDTYVPRLGVLVRPSKLIEVRAGYAFEQSPFSKMGLGNFSILDNDRHRIGLGLGFFPRFASVKYPLQFDLAGTLLPLVYREEILDDGTQVESAGFGYGASINATVGF